MINTHTHKHTRTSLLASAFVNSIDIFSDDILDLSLAIYPLYGRLSPCISFNHDNSLELAGPKPSFHSPSFTIYSLLKWE